MPCWLLYARLAEAFQCSLRNQANQLKQTFSLRSRSRRRRGKIGLNPSRTESDQRRLLAGFETTIGPLDCSTHFVTSFAGGWSTPLWATCDAMRSLSVRSNLFWSIALR